MLPRLRPASRASAYQSSVCRLFWPSSPAGGSSCAPSNRYNAGMSESNAPTAPATPEPMLLSALLTPHRSLSSAGFFVVMGLIVGISFVGGLVFLSACAWPVIGFLGLDVALVYWAFRANYLAAAAYEEVTVTPFELRVKKVSARGKIAEWSLNPVWCGSSAKRTRNTGCCGSRSYRAAEILWLGAFSGRPRRRVSRRRFPPRLGRRNAGPH